MTLRSPAVAGMFYPDDPTALSSLVDAQLAQAAGGPAAKAYIVPHAGFVYSGPTAATAYAEIASARGTITRVVLLGPLHRVPLDGVGTAGVDAWRTPLGDVRIGTPSSLDGLATVVDGRAAHAPEHSMEVQLPFLQTVLGDVEVVPLACGRVSATDLADVIEAVWGGPETLVLVSSDLSHYLPYAEATETDGATLRLVLAASGEIDHDRACGATPVNGLLEVARRRSLRPRLIDYRNSGDTAGDRSRVVGYAAVAFEEE